jgi:hypothetical protein
LQNQRKIESLTLITNHECWCRGWSGANVIDPRQFGALRSLEWRGITRLETIRCFLKDGNDRIEKLVLDFVDPYDTLFATLEKVMSKVKPLQALSHLSLSAIWLDYRESETFNLKGLRILTLVNCPETLDWLEWVTELDIIMDLETFELVFNPAYCCSRSDDGDYLLTQHVRIVGDFIGQISGLKDLYLMLPEPTDWSTILDKVRCSGSLRRVVTHQLGRDENFRDNFSDRECPWIPTSGQLKCFGTSASPQGLVGPRKAARDLDS